MDLPFFRLLNFHFNVMKSSLLLLIAVLVHVSASASGIDNWRVAVEDPEYLHRSVKKVTDVIIEDIFSPPVVCRIYAYATIAGYEAALHGNAAYISLAGQIPHLKPVPKPEAGKLYSFTLASVNAVLGVAKAMVFSTDKLEAFEAQLMAEIRATGIPDDVFRNSVAYGQEVARHILEWSAGDNYKQTRAMEKHSFGDKPGAWQPTPPAYMKAVEPHWNLIRPFLLTSADQFKPAPPAPYSTAKDSQFYREAMEVYDAVLKMTDEQKAIASFWDCNPFKMNIRGHVMFATKKISPGGHWISIAALVCRKVNADFLEAMNAYVCLSLTLSDSFISCWDEKYRSNVIRPETYINQEIDPSWMPLLQTPPFPEYTSGHSVVSTAAAVMLTELFGDGFQFSDSTELEFGLPVRHFTSFHHAAEEAAISRLYGGIHYMPAIVNGATEGRNVGEYFVQNLRTRRAESVDENR